MNTHYTSLSVEELTQDDRFRKWITDQEESESWTSWHQGLSPQQSREVDQAIELVQLLSHDAKSDDMNFAIKDRLWKRINNSIDTQSEDTGSSNTRWLWPTIGAIAASMMLIVIFQPFSNASIVEVYAEVAESVLLPADSKVALAEGATIKYDNENWDNQRDVQLSGKAFFDVSKGKPFVISTESGSVSVLGTSFDVEAEEDHLYVTVSTGRVEVATQINTEILTPGDQYFYNPVVEDFSDWEVPSGRAYYRFKMKPAASVLDIVSAVYGVEVDIKINVGSMQATCFFDSQDGLETVLQKVLWPLNLKYDIKDKIVTVIE